MQPPSQKLHQIIARTATFVCRHGGQSEIVLRVKQGDNPTFGFLMPGHELHPYFRYLVDHPELLHSEHEANLQEECKKHGENENSKGGDGALSLLGSVYGSGEDEEGDNHAETKQYLAEDGGNAGSDIIPLGSKKIEFVEAHVVKDESGFKTTILSNKEKVLKVRENASIVTSGSGSGNVVDEKSSSSHAAGDKPINSIAGVEPLIIEPPSETKILIDKLVEFVARNGKLFESNLIAQDSKHGRFPFLVPSNPYHAYYLKALQAAQECKLNGKSSSSGREESVVHEKDKKAYEKDSLGDMPPESDRKEKFKMVIRKSKDTQETEPKEAQQESTVTVDAASAAAILQAAIRGIKPFPTGSSAHDGSDKSGQSGSVEKSIARAASVEADSSEAQLTQEKNRKAERLKRAKMFVAMLKSGTVPFKAGASRSSSMEPLEHGVVRSENDRDNVDGEDERVGRLAPADVDKPATVEKLERNYFGEENNARLRNRKYRTRSEACEDDSEVPDVDHMEGDGRHRRRKHRSKSRKEGEDKEDEQVLESEKRHRKRRHTAHSSNSVEIEGKGDGSEEDRSHKHHKSRRGYDHSSSDEDGHDKDKRHKSSRKKHRSHHSSHRHTGKRRSSKHDSHREDESDEEERGERHHRKKRLSSRDKHRSKKKNSSRDHRSSGDDENQNLDNLVMHRRGSHNEKVAVEVGEIGSKVSEESKRVDVNDRETSQLRALASQPSEPNAEIPEDLRAKIRAMLMATRL